MADDTDASSRNVSATTDPGNLADDGKEKLSWTVVQTRVEPPPNGGTQAWLQCLGAFCLFFTSWGIVNTWGTFQALYQQNALSEWSPFTVTWIGSLQAFLMVFSGTFAGPLFDMGFLKALLVVGSVVSVFGIMMTSLCDQYWHFLLAQGVMVGIGFGGLFVPSVAIIPSYFTTKKSLAQGIAASGSSIGGIVYPIMLQHLESRVGLAWATRVLGFVMLATLAIPAATMRMRTKPAARRRFIDETAFHEGPFMLFCIAQFFAFAGLYIPFFFIEQYALEETATSPSLAFYFLPLMNAGSFFGRILSSIAADRMGPLNVLLLCSVTSIAVAFSWIACQTTGSTIAFCVIYGAITGSFVSLPPIIVFTMCPSFAVMGTRTGMVLVFMALGLLFGNPIAGAILRDGGWTALKLFCGALIALSTLLLMVSQQLQTRVKVGTKAKA